MKNPKLSEITLLDLLAGFALAGLMATPGNRKEIETAAKITGERESVVVGKACCGAAVSVLEEIDKEREAYEERMKGAKS